MSSALLRSQPFSAASAQGFATSPFMQTNPPGLKLMIVGRRKPGTTLAEHRHHILHVHGELVLRYIVTDPENVPQRYVQNQVLDGQFCATGPRGSALRGPTLILQPKNHQSRKIIFTI